MGTDIHMVVEVRVDGVWGQAAPFCPCWDCDGLGNRTWDYTSTGGTKGSESCYWCSGSGITGKYQDRNYDVFSVLGNVRNGTGFAGCDTGDEVPVISDGRGIPDDCTLTDDDLGGEHSTTWCSLAELLTYDWTYEKIRRGWVTLEEYRVFNKEGRPSGWCGAVMGRNVRHIPNFEMDKLLDADAIVPQGGLTSVYTQVQWGLPISESCGDFYSKFIPALQGLAQSLGVSPEDVRLVYNFDS